MAGLDFALLGAYFLVVAGIGVWSAKRSLKDSRSYFLGGGTVGWLAIGTSLFASNISAEHFIGLTGTGATSGLAVGQFEWLACLILLLLGWLFVPFYMRTGVFTMPEFLEKRYNAACRTYLSSISLIAYVFTKISVAIYAGTLVLTEILGWDMWASAIVLIVATGAYTVFGGLRAVIYTELFQAFVLIAGAVFLTIASVSQAGGLNVMVEKVDADFFNLWKAMDHPDFPWTGILFGAPIVGIWYWCTDQMIVQRTLAAKNLKQARRGTILAGFLKILPVFILVLPGIAGGTLFPDTAPDELYSKMVNELLPAGIKGIVVAALLAALMSSLAAVFNSSSTLVVMDFYKKWRPGAPEKELVRAGQVATVVLVLIGLAWLPFIGHMSNQLYIYLQSVQAYISPPIAAVFLVGILWRRANSTGALAALLSGFVLGAVRFVSEVGVKSGWAMPTWMSNYASYNFLHIAIFLFAVAMVVIVFVSVVTAKPTPENLAMFSRSDTPGDSGGGKSSALNIILSVLLVLIVLMCWAYFSKWFFVSQ